MRWPGFWPFPRQPNNDEDEDSVTPAQSSPPSSLTSRVNAQLAPPDSPSFTSSQTLLLSLSTAALSIAAFQLYRTRLARIANVASLPPSLFHSRRGLYGRVTSVGDGDNFHVYHTPGGVLAGWGWARQVPSNARALRGRTLHVRVAGVDAPEMAHFGRPEQAFGKEARTWLSAQVLGKAVRVRPFRGDQYGRIVGAVSRWGWTGRKDVGLEMLRAGVATVYEAKFGSEFGGRETEYRAAEQRAKEKGVGMWQRPGLVRRLLGASKQNTETPREYKTRMQKEDLAR